ncbi:MAG: molybdenum cofactor biosynthesis protein C [Candidatus Epulonipiscioides saccharophilum]|nr:MAG: molybdenum cofactor biosynthesis protein C [Epulopiscium sp. AS2M-Bin001]
MVDVSDKEKSERIAVARGTIYVNEEVFEVVKYGKSKKGDVLNVARIAGIMGIKKTSELIPMCHPLMITQASIEFEIDENRLGITAYSTVKVSGQTGVEMEALTGVNIALLTIYDMCKALDRSMRITDIFLVEKNGGKSGNYKVEK